MNSFTCAFPPAVLVLAALVIPGIAVAQDSGHESPLFREQDVLRVRIEGPLGAMTKERSDKQYYDGTLSYQDGSGTEHALDIGFRARGNFRRREEICPFPPLRLSFDAEEVKGTLFEDQEHLKLVTHCQPRFASYEQYLLKEYLAYRILQLHTQWSFRVRLLEITWVDTDDGSSITRHGFLIESEKNMAERLGATAVEEPGLPYESLDRHAAAIAFIFEYLIANTDFSLVTAAPGESCCHNAVLLDTGREDAEVPVPFDFDFSGFVHPPYARPNPRLGIRSVSIRLYRGVCLFNDDLPAALSLYREQEAAVVELVTRQEGLDDKVRSDALDFLGDFYSEARDPAAMLAQLTQACR